MYKVYIQQSVWDNLVYESSIHSFKETGGVLIGYIVKNEIVITDCTDPGPDAKHQLFNFQRDVKYCNEILFEKHKQSNGVLGYLGEWHTHPFGKPIPSSQDNKSMFEIAQTEHYQNDSPLLIIVRYKKDKISIGTFIYNNNKKLKVDFVIFQ